MVRLVDTVRFGILGPLVLERAGQQVAVGRPKQRALLALLLTEAGRTVSVDRMIDELWGDEPPPKATASLQAYVSNLRRILEPDRAPGTPGSVLVTEPPGYRLHVTSEQVDSTRFEELARVAHHALDGGTAADALDAANAALALWRGPALAEFRDQGFAEATVARLEELRHACEEDRAAAMLALGLHATAVAELEAAVRHQPLRERRWALLITALYRTGRSADALDRYQQLRSVLLDELGLDPSPELQDLERAVLQHDDAVLGPAYRPAEREATSPTTPSPPAPDRAAALLERGTEVAEVERALDDMTSGRTRVLVIEGDAGLGKTALAEEAARLARRRGLGVAFGGCHEDADAPPLWPWTQVLRSLGGDVPVAGPASDAFSVLDSTAASLAARARHQAAVCVIEDVHWADPATLRMLGFVAVELRDVPLLLVVTARPDEQREVVGPAISALLRHPGSVHLLLQPLSPPATQQLAETIAGDREVDLAGLHDRTGGNPLFVTELARLLAAEGSQAGVPVGVREVIARRLRRLPDEANALLSLGAVAGADVDLGLVARASGVAHDRVADLLDAAVAIGVLRAGSAPGRLGFAHALVREAVLDSLSALHRRRLHARLVSAYEDRAASGGAALYEWAHHAVEAVPFVPAADARSAAESAATRADADLAFDTAARWWRAALAVHDASPELAEDAPERARLLLALAGSSSREGADDDAQALVVEALDVAEACGDTSLAVQAASALADTGGAWLWVKPGADPSALLARFERSLGALDRADDAGRAAVLGTMATGFVHGIDVERADELSTAALDAARRTGDPLLVGRALSARWRSIWRPGYAAEMLAVSDELDAVSAEAPGAGFDLQAAVCRHIALLTLTDVPGALDAIERALAMARERRLIQFEAHLLPNLVSIDLLRGDLDAAERRAADVVRLWERIQFPLVGGMRSLLLWVLRSQAGPMEEAIEAMESTVALVYPRWRAVAEHARGDHKAAAASLLVDPAAGSVRPQFDGTATATFEADLAADLGVVAVSERAAAELAPHQHELAAVGTAACYGPVAYPLGRSLAALGRVAEAAAAFRTAIDIAERNDLITSAVWARIRLAEILDGDEARQSAEAARAVASSHGLTRAAAAADEVLGQQASLRG